MKCQQPGCTGTIVDGYCDVCGTPAGAPVATETPAEDAASIASGSFRTRGMVIAPCSIRTMAEIATGTTSSALTRAADVVLKERRPLVLMLRETPLHAGHLENLLKLARLGAIIAPPVPAFYIRPKSVDDLVDHAVGRVLDLLDLDTDLPHRWREAEN